VLAGAASLLAGTVTADAANRDAPRTSPMPRWKP